MNGRPMDISSPNFAGYGGGAPNESSALKHLSAPLAIYEEESCTLTMLFQWSELTDLQIGTVILQDFSTDSYSRFVPSATTPKARSRTANGGKRGKN
jgi:hypothetical protein